MKTKKAYSRFAVNLLFVARKESRRKDLAPSASLRVGHPPYKSSISCFYQQGSLQILLTRRGLATARSRYSLNKKRANKKSSALFSIKIGAKGFEPSTARTPSARPLPS